MNTAEFLKEKGIIKAEAKHLIIDFPDDRSFDVGELLEEYVDVKVLEFIDWFGTWEMDKNIEDYGINEIQDEFNKSRNL